MNKRTVGSQKEETAAAFLSGCGLHVTEHSFRDRFGEIDLIARDDDTLVFIEVKYRKTASTGHPEEAVGISKQKTISKVAAHYMLYRKYPPSTPVRFDVVAIEGEDIRWHKNAFPFMG